jgi:hypothetical protein
MLFFLLGDFFYVSGVGGVPYLDKPRFPGSANYLGGDVGVFITSRFLRALSISSLVISTVMQSGGAFVCFQERIRTSALYLV